MNLLWAHFSFLSIVNISEESENLEIKLLMLEFRLRMTFIYSLRSQLVRVSNYWVRVTLICQMLTKSGVISRWIAISPTTSLQSPSLSNTTAQLAVGVVSEIRLALVDVHGSVSRRKFPFWSRPNADMSETAPLSFCKPSAMLRPTPPPENFVSDLYVAPFSCTKETNKEISQNNFHVVKNSDSLHVWEKARESFEKKRKIYCHWACWGKVLWAATRMGGRSAYCYASFCVSISGRYKG